MLVITCGQPDRPAVATFRDRLVEVGTGTGGLGGVVLLAPTVTASGQRRKLDGLLFTPEGLAVVDVESVSRQSGYLFAPAHGAWTVGGQLLQLDDGGGNPTPASDAAVKAIVAALRQGGIDPGYVQALIAVNGELSGVAQPETERGHGVVVSRLTGADLLTAVRLATAPSAGGLRQLWTTADVIAAMRALRIEAPLPSIELFTDEGFPYSPYVLRPTSVEDLPFAGEESFLPPDTTQPTRHVPNRPPGGGSATQMVPSMPGGPGGYPQQGPPMQYQPGALPAGQAAFNPYAPPPGVAPQQRRDDAGGLALVGGGSEDSGTYSGTYQDRRSGQERRDGQQAGKGFPPWLRWVLVGVVLLVAAVLLLRACTDMLDTSGGGEARNTQDPTSEPSATTAPPGTPAPQAINGTSFQPQVTEVTAAGGCAPHAYGQMQDFLTATPCAGMNRALFSATVNGRPVVVSVADVVLSDEANASAFKELVDTNGTGNVNDLLAEGKTYEGAPAKIDLDNAAYASSLDGKTVRIIEVGWTDDGDPAAAPLDQVATSALKLEI